MDKKELDKLKVLVHRLGFDERIDYKLTEYIRQGQRAFYIPYRMDVGKDYLVCELVFTKDEVENYQFNGYSAALYKAINIPNLTIQGVDLRLLQHQLERLSKPAAGKLDAGHEDMLISIGNSMEVLRQTPDGRKLTELLMARYRPPGSGLRLEYDAAADRYMLGRVVPEGELITVRKCLRLLIDEMEKHIPDFVKLENPAEQQAVAREFVVAAVAIDVKSGAKLAIKSDQSFTEPKEVLPLLTALDNRLFDKDFVRQHAGQLKWYLKEVSLLDAASASPVITLRSQAPDQSADAGVKMSIEIHHPDLGWITFREQGHRQSPDQVPSVEIAGMQRMLTELGLVKPSKNVSVKVLPPPPKRPARRNRRRGGGPKPS